MDVTVPMLQIVLLVFLSTLPVTWETLGVTFTPAASPTLAQLSTRQPIVGISLVLALDLLRLLLRECAGHSGQRHI